MGAVTSVFAWGLRLADCRLTCGGVMAGVRRLRLAGRRAGQLHGGEERGAQRQLAARLRGHRRHQGEGAGLRDQ